jgi:NitT/TauT family transport system substrate-binding protein
LPYRQGRHFVAATLTSQAAHPPFDTDWTVMKRHFPLILIAGGVLAVAAVALLVRGQRAHAGTVTLTMALPAQLAAGSVHVGLAQGMFERHDIALATQTFKIGKHALESVLSGHADLAIVGDTPFVLAALRGEKMAVVGNVFASRSAMAVLGWRERGIRGGADLAGKTIGTVPGTNSQFFIDALLTANGIGRNQVKLVELKAEALPDALRSGRVDAVTLWHPDLARMQNELGAAGQTILGDDIFVFRFLLVGRADFVAANRAQVASVVAALAEATDFIHEQPQSAGRIVGRALGLEPAILASSFHPLDFSLALDQSMLLALSDQSRWAHRMGLAGSLATPDYFAMMEQGPLRAARPAAIRVIQ